MVKLQQPFQDLLQAALVKVQQRRLRQRRRLGGLERCADICAPLEHRCLEFTDVGTRQLEDALARLVDVKRRHRPDTSVLGEIRRGVHVDFGEAGDSLVPGGELGKLRGNALARPAPLGEEVDHEQPRRGLGEQLVKGFERRGVGDRRGAVRHASGATRPRRRRAAPTQKAANRSHLMSRSASGAGGLFCGPVNGRCRTY